MPTEKKKVTRKLSAILSADVKGYSVLMADDEVHTIETLKAYRQIIFYLVSKHYGRVVDSPGDNVLAEFRSSVDAVECAVKIQKRLDLENSKYADDKKVEFRIGVNVGDVIQDGAQIYGNGVNVAARIEGLADPGGVCISRNAYDHISDKLNFGYKYLGEHSVKNIKKPVRVYKLLMADEDAGKLIGERPKPLVKNLFWATAVLALIVITSVVWQVYQKMNEPEFEPAKIENMAYPLPEKASIAVLAFENLSDDSEQEYFCDGLSEEIITALSKSSQIFVIARNSSFKYKGKPVKVQQVAEELGVHYVLEGSVRKDKERVRITAQLIDAVKGIHLWADRYDRNLNDIFAIQDDITKQIIAALHVKLTIGEDARIIEKGTGSLDAYLLYLQARELHFQFSKDDNIKSRQLLEQVISIDPKYGSAYSLMAASHMIDVWIQATDNPQISIKKAIELATKAKDYWDGSHDLLGFLYSMVGQLEKAMIECKKSVDLYPNSSTSRAFYGIVLRTVGRYEEAITELEKSVRLDPFASSFSLRTLGFSYALAGKYDEAIDVGRKSVKKSPEDIMAKLFLALSYGFAGRMEEARLESKNILRLNPNFNLDSFVKRLTIQDEEIKKRIKKTLQLAGLPEYPPGKEPPEKPSIAVLPFDNMSGEPEQEYFSDGISEDIITDLSKISGLIVIARNSSFSFKGKSINVRQIGEELNVRYLLEGSVRKAGNQVRINAQLIDAINGQHLWADRYDGDMNNIFALQDEITRNIISALALTLTKGEQKALIDKGTDNIQAYDEFLKGWQGYRLLTKEGFAQAKIHLEKAVEIDSDFTRAYAAMAILYWKAIQLAAPELRKGLGLNDRAAKSAAQAKPNFLLKKAMTKPTALAHGLMSQLFLFRYQHDEALAEIERAVAMDPNDPELYSWMSHIFWLLGRNSDAIESAERGMRLDPMNPAAYLIQLGKDHIPDGNLEESFQVLERAKRLNPELSGSVALSQSIIYGMQGRYKDARSAYENFLKHRLHPVRNLNDILLYFPFADPSRLDPIAKALIIAGAPGSPTDYYRILKENRIAGEDIESRFFGRTIVGIAMSTGKPVQWSFEKSGEFQLKMGDFQDRGKSWVEGDVIFLQYKKFFGGLPYGATIYRNPDGSVNSKNQYFIVSDLGSITPVALIE